VNGALEPREPDLLDRIASALPLDVRADYYREMRYLRSLPENDEMLHILRAMQFLTGLIFDAPLRTANENEKLKAMFVEAFGTLQELVQSMKAQQAQLDQRLKQLPEAVAAGIRPEAMAAAINESLRQEFLKSTLPETANALAATGAQIKKCQIEFTQVTKELSNSYTGALEETRKKVERLESTCAESIQRVESMAVSAKHVFDQGNHWTLYVLLTAAFLLGIGVDRGYQYFLDSRVPLSVSAPEVSSPALAQAPASKTPATKPRTKH
jgi:exonuclease VII small subunit